MSLLVICGRVRGPNPSRRLVFNNAFCVVWEIDNYSVTGALLVTTYPLDRESLGGGGWVDRHVKSQITRAGIGLEVFTVATLAAGTNSVRLEVRTDPLALSRIALRMLWSGTPYAVAKFRGTKAWQERIEQLKAASVNKHVIASQFPSLLLCHDAGVQPCLYIAHNVESVLAKRHNPRLLELWRDSGRLETLERQMIAKAIHVAAISTHDQERLRYWNDRTLHLKLLDGIPVKKHGAGRKAIGFLGKASWPPNKLALGVLMDEVMPQVRARLAGEAPGLVIAGSGTNLLPAAESVLCLGEIDDISEFYDQISLVVVPRFGPTTGVSVKLLEAVEQGVVVIAPRQLAEAAGLGPQVIHADSVAEMVEAIVGVFETDHGRSQTFTAQSSPGPNYPWTKVLG